MEKENVGEGKQLCFCCSLSQETGSLWVWITFLAAGNDVGEVYMHHVFFPLGQKLRRGKYNGLTQAISRHVDVRVVVLGLPLLLLLCSNTRQGRGKRKDTRKDPSRTRSRAIIMFTCLYFRIYYMYVWVSGRVLSSWPSDTTSLIQLMTEPRLFDLAWFMFSARCVKLPFVVLETTLPTASSPL